MRPPREVRKERFSPGEGVRGGIHLDSSNGGMNGPTWGVGLIIGLVPQVVWLSCCFFVLPLFLH